MDTPLKMKTQQKPGSKATRKDENDLKISKNIQNDYNVNIRDLKFALCFCQYSDLVFGIASVT